MDLFVDRSTFSMDSLVDRSTCSMGLLVDRNTGHWFLCWSNYRTWVSLLIELQDMSFLVDLTEAKQEPGWRSQVTIGFTLPHSAKQVESVRTEFIKAAIIPLHDEAKYLRICTNFWTNKRKTGKTCTNFMYLSQIGNFFLVPHVFFM